MFSPYKEPANNFINICGVCASESRFAMRQERRAVLSFFFSPNDEKNCFEFALCLYVIFAISLIIFHKGFHNFSEFGREITVLKTAHSPYQSPFENPCCKCLGPASGPWDIRGHEAASYQRKEWESISL